MTDLFAQHQGLALRIASAMAGKLPRNVAREDLEQAALIGLHQWCTAHPDSSQPGWRGGLILRVRGAVLDWLRAEDYLSRGARAKGELQLIHLEDLSGEDGPGWQDTLGQFEKPNDYARLDALAALEADLPTRERHLIIESFGRGTTQAELARELRVSEQRISQLLTRAKQTMREHLQREREVVGTTVASVTVLATPKWRTRDFYSELRHVVRTSLCEKMRDAPAASQLASMLAVPETTAWRWTGPGACLPRFLRGQSGALGEQLRERARTLVAGAHREADGSLHRIADMLTVSPQTARRLVRVLMPEVGRDRRTNAAVSTAEIQRLGETGLTPHQIARQLGCSRCLVRGRLGLRPPQRPRVKDGCDS